MADTSESATEPRQPLRLLVKGFAGFDMRLLEGVVKLSKLSTPVLDLVDDSGLSTADVIMIDGKDSQAVAWAQQNKQWLLQRAVVWVDAPYAVPAGHTSLQRPVQWTGLPVILSRAMDDAVSYVEISMAAAQGGQVDQDPQIEQDVLSAPAPEAAKQSSKPSILVVDDSAAVRGHLQSALGAVGYEVTAVDSGEAAIMAVNVRPYDCILMDVLMSGISGYDACRRIKSMPLHDRLIKPAIIMLTSKSSPFDKIRGRMAGCDAYLTKPVQKSELMRVLAEHSFKKMMMTA